MTDKELDGQIKKTFKACSVEGCGRKNYARGYCNRHYRLWQEYGVPRSLSPRYQRTVEQRFWDFVDKTGTCWLWLGSKVCGYGQFNLNGKTVRSHHYSFFLSKGMWPTLDVLHSCDTPSCVNPDHLREGTDKDNAADRDSRSRRQAPKGELNGMAKLTEAMVMQARLRYSAGELIADLADAYGVKIGPMRKAIKGRSWRHL